MAKERSKQEIFSEIIKLLKDLNKKHPDQNILRHISDATSEYPSLWEVSNKEFLYLLEKYEVSMYLPDEDELTHIINDGKNLHTKEFGSEDVSLEDNIDQEYC